MTNPFDDDSKQVEMKTGSGRSSASSSWINQFKDTIAKKYKKPQLSSPNTTVPTSKTIQRLRDIMAKPAQYGGDIEESSISPPSGQSDTSKDTTSDTASQVSSPTVNTTADTPTDTNASTAPTTTDTTESSDKTSETTTEPSTSSAPVSSSVDENNTMNTNVEAPKKMDAPNATGKSADKNVNPDELMKRMNEISDLLRKQMSAPYGTVQLPSISLPQVMPQLSLPQMSMPSMPTLNDAKGVLDGAKSFLNVGSFNTDAMKETFLSGVKILSDTVERYTKWADTYRERQERLEKDAKSNPEYTKVRSDFETSMKTAVPRRTINPIKYIPIDVKRNARIPPYAQLDLPAMKEVVRLQDEIYGPRGRPTTVGMPSQLGPFRRDPYATIQEPLLTQIKPEDSELSKNTAEQTTPDTDEGGFFNIKPQQIFNASLGLVVAQLGVVGYYILKSM